MSETRGLWNSAEIAAATNGRAGKRFSADGVSIDSRKIVQGDLFVALHGPNFDGNDFVAGALTAGAAGALVDRLPAGMAADMPVVVIGDTLQGLQDLGGAARARTPAKFTAVTGSVGKTSTKEALKAALEPFGRTYASVGNLNNHWGAPLSLARMPRDTEYGVFELGMNSRSWCSPRSRSSPRSRRCISSSSPRWPRSPTPRPRSWTAWTRPAPWSCRATIRTTTAWSRMPSVAASATSSPSAATRPTRS
jgi:UDP-N-acetylmuramoyl-tripeptide--D-alanyl-D-alanine ligase